MIRVTEEIKKKGQNKNIALSLQVGTTDIFSNSFQKNLDLLCLINKDFNAS